MRVSCLLSDLAENGNCVIKWSAVYHFIIFFPFQITYPPVQQRPAWTQPLTLLTDNVGYSTAEIPTSKPLPYLQTGTATFTLPSTVWTPINQGPAPHPPSLRSRPLSAGATRRTGAFEKFQTIGGTPVASPIVQRRKSSQFKLTS